MSVGYAHTSGIRACQWDTRTPVGYGHVSATRACPCWQRTHCATAQDPAQAPHVLTSAPSALARTSTTQSMARSDLELRVGHDGEEVSVGRVEQLHHVLDCAGLLPLATTSRDTHIISDPDDAPTCSCMHNISAAQPRSPLWVQSSASRRRRCRRSEISRELVACSSLRETDTTADRDGPRAKRDCGSNLLESVGHLLEHR
eukprot:8258-Rhodomonas_salina.1